MNEHSREPWRVRDEVSPCQIVDADNKLICVCAALTFPLLEQASNAARIVGCVNACIGINPEAAPQLVALAEHVLRCSQQQCLYDDAKAALALTHVEAEK